MSNHYPDINASAGDPRHPQNMHADGTLEPEDCPPRRPMFDDAQDEILAQQQREDRDWNDER